MNNLEIVEKYYHSNGNCAPFVVAIVDDPKSNDTKLVIMFDEEDFTAVLSLDTLIETEEVSPEENGHSADKYERALRNHLWNIEEEDDDDLFDDEESEQY
jgi:hypothetical protein